MSAKTKSQQIFIEEWQNLWKSTLKVPMGRLGWFWCHFSCLIVGIWIPSRKLSKKCFFKWLNKLSKCEAWKFVVCFMSSKNLVKGYIGEYLWYRVKHSLLYILISIKCCAFSLLVKIRFLPVFIILLHHLDVKKNKIDAKTWEKEEIFLLFWFLWKFLKTPFYPLILIKFWYLKSCVWKPLGLCKLHLVWNIQDFKKSDNSMFLVGIHFTTYSV